MRTSVRLLHGRGGGHTKRFLKQRQDNQGGFCCKRNTGRLLMPKTTGKSVSKSGKKYLTLRLRGVLFSKIRKSKRNLAGSHRRNRLSRSQDLQAECRDTDSCPPRITAVNFGPLDPFRDRHILGKAIFRSPLSGRGRSKQKAS